MIWIVSRINEYLRMAWFALKSHKLRSFLTTLGILIGVTTIITIWTTISGLNEYVYGQLSNIGATTVYIQKMPWVVQEDWWKYRNRPDITFKEYEALQRYSRKADYISPEVYASKRVSYRNKKYDNVTVIGSNEHYKETRNSYPDVGRFLTELDVRRTQPVCVIGNELANRLFNKQTPIGKRIKIGLSKYRVIGVLEQKGSFFGQSMDNVAIVPIGRFREVFGGRRSIQIAVQTGDAGQLQELKDEVRGILRRVRKVPPGEPDNFAINQQNMLTELYAQMTSTLFAIVFVIGGISLVVGGIGIMNIMLVSVTERTREIGIRKAVGAKRKHILSQFLIESVLIALVGGVLGIVLGYIGGTIVLQNMNLSSGMNVSSIVIGFGFSAFVGILAGFYPARKASKFNPIESLRYE